jgi:Flp pilus assembly protein TadD
MAKKPTLPKSVPTQQPTVADAPRGFLAKAPFHLLLVMIVALAAYANTFHGPFLFDDTSSITDNQVIKNLSTFLSGKGYAYNPRRFLGYLSFAVNYKLGGLNVVGYHLVNLAIHILSGWLVYALVRLTLKTPFFENRGLGTGDLESEKAFTLHSSPFTLQRLLPLFVALLFVAHPIQTQAITYIVQRLASLATMFYLGSLALYVWGRLLQERHGQPYHPKVVLLFILSLIVGLAAMRTKEIAMTLPIAAILYDFSFFGKGVKKRYILFCATVITLAVVGAGIIHSEKPLGELLSDVSRFTRESQLPRLDYLFTQFTVIVTYIRLLFLPVGQNLDYDYPVYDSFFAPQVFLSFLFLIALLTGAIYLYNRSSGDREPGTGNSVSPFTGYFRLIAFGILWFFLTLAIESSIIPISDVIFEHRLYLPSFGAFLAIAAGFLLILRNTDLAIKGVAAASIVLILAGATFYRNATWGDAISLWRDAAAKSPNKARPHYSLGHVLLQAKEFDEALVETQYAVKLAPQDSMARNNLGSALEKKGMLDQAINEYRLSLGINPNFPTALANLGAALEKQGSVDAAIVQYRQALAIDGNSMVAHNNLGGALLKGGQYAEAMKELREAIGMDPDAVEPRNNLAIAYERSGDLDRAIAAYNDILALHPGYAEGYHNLGVAYFRKHDLDKAISNYDESLRLNPNFTRAYINRGIAYATKGEVEKALGQFQQAQQVSPGDKESADLVAKTLAFLKMQKK